MSNFELMDKPLQSSRFRPVLRTHCQIFIIQFLSMKFNWKLSCGCSFHKISKQIVILSIRNEFICPWILILNNLPSFHEWFSKIISLFIFFHNQLSKYSNITCSLHKILVISKCKYQVLIFFEMREIEELKQIQSFHSLLIHYLRKLLWEFQDNGFFRIRQENKFFLEKSIQNLGQKLSNRSE